MTGPSSPKPPRPTPAELEAARDVLIPDVIAPDLKVLFISGYIGEDGTLPEKLPFGFTFLPKPFTLGALVSIEAQLVVVTAAFAAMLVAESRGANGADGADGAQAEPPDEETAMDAGPGSAAESGWLIAHS